MAYSIQRAVSDGTMTLLPVSIEYFDRSEIKVAFDDVVSSTGWSWVGATDKTLAFSPAIPNGVEVSVIRTTDLSELRHQYALGAQFTAESMDESFKQVMHIAQEAAERQLGGDFFTDVNMHGYQIQNLGPATAPDHAVTLQQYQADANGASAAKDIAVAAAASASSSASAAGASATSAGASASAASSSASAASASKSAASASASSASTSASTATTKAAEAVVSASSAAASAAAASVSETNAAASAAAALHPWEGEGGGIHYDSGNVRIGGVSARITGDFSNATIANRLLFQTSTVNGYTTIGVIPNGTATVAEFRAYSDSGLANGAVAGFQQNSTDLRIFTGVYGTGTYLPMTFYTGGSERMRIDTSGYVKSISNAKAWVNFDGTLSGTITPRSNLNIASVTKNGTGDYTLNIASGVLADANYSWSGSTPNWPASGVVSLIQEYMTNSSTLVRTATALRIYTLNGGAIGTDYKVVSVNIFGN